MNATDIADDHDDFNVEDLDHHREALEALERAAEAATDRNSAGLDHVNAAKRALRRCIDVIADVRIDTSALSGRALTEHLEQLVEIEGDLSRAEGELIDAGH